MVYLESRAKKHRARRRFWRLFWLLVLMAGAAAGVYWQEPLLVFYQEVQRALNPPDVEKILKEGRREEFGVYCVGPEQATDCYLFDDQGVILGKAKTFVGEVLIKIDDVSDYKPQLKQSFLPAADWQNSWLILDFLKSGQIKPEVITLKRSSQELAVRSDGPRLFFSYRFDPTDHLAALRLLRQKPNWFNLSYIDLRTENRVFYK